MAGDHSDADRGDGGELSEATACTLDAEDSHGWFFRRKASSPAQDIWTMRNAQLPGVTGGHSDDPLAFARRWLFALF